MSLRSVQNRLQQIYNKLAVHQPPDTPREDGVFNLRARAVTVAMLRKLLNYGALEKAEAELQHWLRGASRHHPQIPAPRRGMAQ